MFDALALKREFPGLADTSLHYLDSAATRMPRLCLRLCAASSLKRAPRCTRPPPAGAHRDRRRTRAMRFLNANSADEIVFTYGATSSINLLAYTWGSSLKAGDEILPMRAG